MRRRFVVYGLLDDDSQCVYVGCTSQPIIERLIAHRRPSSPIARIIGRYPAARLVAHVFGRYKSVGPASKLEWFLVWKMSPCHNARSHYYYRNTAGLRTRLPSNYVPYVNTLPSKPQRDTKRGRPLKGKRVNPEHDGA